MRNKCNLVMLPTENKSNIWLRQGKLEVNSSASSRINPQHLYITSDDEIKEGDWVLTPEGKILQFGQVGTYLSKDKKIIATTDSSLTVPTDIEERKDVLYDNSLPQIPESFIKKFVEEYNKGNVIKEVMVEYEIVHPDLPILDTIKNINLIIEPIKDSWSREEVEELLYKSLDATVTSHPKIREVFNEQLSKWIKENL